MDLEFNKYKKQLYKAYKAIKQVKMDGMEGFTQQMIKDDQEAFKFSQLDKYPENIERLYVDAGKAAELVSIVKEIKDEIKSNNRKRKREDADDDIYSLFKKVKFTNENNEFNYKTWIKDNNGINRIVENKAYVADNKDLNNFVYTSILLQKYEFMYSNGFMYLRLHIPQYMYKLNKN